MRRLREKPLPGCGGLGRPAGSGKTRGKPCAQRAPPRTSHWSHGVHSRSPTRRLDRTRPSGHGVCNRRLRREAARRQAPCPPGCPRSSRHNCGIMSPSHRLRSRRPASASSLRLPGRPLKGPPPWPTASLLRRQDTPAFAGLVRLPKFLKPGTEVLDTVTLSRGVQRPAPTRTPCASS